MIEMFNPFEGSSIAYGSNISISMNQSTNDYVISVKLINDQGKVIGTSSIDLPIESLVKNGRYDAGTKTVILILENDDEITIPIEDLISGLQEEITDQNKLNADFVDDSNSNNKFNVQANWNQNNSEADDFIKNKPNIPVVNNGTLIIKVNGEVLDTFSANEENDKEINITAAANEVEVTTASVEPQDENVELWIDLNSKETILIPDTWIGTESAYEALETKTQDLYYIYEDEE